MRPAAAPVPFDRIAAFRDRHRAEADCQIVRDSILPRGLAQAYLIEADGEPAGYGGVWLEHFPGRVMELWLEPAVRSDADACFRALLGASGATEVEAQTNLPQLNAMRERFAPDGRVEKLLFEDAPAGDYSPTEAPADAEGQVSVPHWEGVVLRRRENRDEGPDGEWVLARDGRLVAAGGIMRHYNPPYCDVYMAVVTEERRRGLGTLLVRELRRTARDQGMIPAARCNVDNEASRRTLLRGGFRACGAIIAGPVAP